MGILNPRFLTVRNQINVLRQSSIDGIVTAGVCWVMISGSFDLSVGAIVSLISVTMVAMLERGN
jgi:ribose transport system permease protein